MSAPETLVPSAVTLALALAPAIAQGGDDALTQVDRKVMAELSGVKATPQIVFHYRPGDLEGAQLDKIVRVNVEQYHHLEKLLKMQYRGRVHVFLYRDVADLQKMTDTSAVAFSTGTVSVHQACDFQSVHELTHIFALQFPNDEDAVSDGFTVEGLATILAETDENVPIHSWAAIYKSASHLPELVEFRRSWPEGAPPGVHPYHVAGSFVGYLIEQFGIDKVKRWYVNSTEAHMEFGKTFRRLERDWLLWLDQLQVDPAHREHVLAKLGLLRKQIPAAYTTAKGIPLFDGKSLRGLKADDPSKWQVRDGQLIGSNPEPWTLLHCEREFPADIGVRVKFRLVAGDAVQIRLNRTGKSVNEVVLARWATFLSLKQGGYASGGDIKITPGAWNEVVMVNDNGTGRLYLNGLLVVESKDAFHHSAGVLGLGIEKGTVEVAEFVAFRL